MKNSLKKKIIEIIVKSGMILSLLLMIFIGSFIAIKYGEDSTYFAICMGLGFGIGVISIVLLYIYPESLERPKVKADKFPLTIISFEDFLKYLDNNIEKIDYKKYEYFGGNKELKCIYYRQKSDILEYYIVYHFEELTMSKSETLEYCDELLESFLQMYYSNRDRNDYLRETFILFVDKESEVFKKIVNTNLNQYGKNGLMIIGVSPSKGIIYVAKQKDGFGKFIYLKLRNNFLKVMNLTKKDRIIN